VVKRFRNRRDAGQQLAAKLIAYADDDKVVVLALPRGGVPVAAEIAKVLHAPLDICLVRKLGVPSQPELAMGAIAVGGVRVLNEQIISGLEITEAAINAVTEQEARELARRDCTYRGVRPACSGESAPIIPSVGDRIVILVDDGLATGSTMRAAIAILQRQHPRKIVVAIPVAPPIVCQQLKQQVEEIVCLIAPESMSAIGAWYEDFSQTSDQEVCQLLQEQKCIQPAEVE
jgi:putative phosphoribosyl transferase